MRTTVSLSLVLAVILGLAVAFPTPTFAQDQTPPDAEDDGTGEATREAPDRRVVFVPYDSLRDLTDANRGVYLPYEEYERLWRAANDDAPEATDPTTAALVYDIGYAGEVLYNAVTQQETAHFTAALKVRVLRDGWVEIPLPFQDVALSEATVRSLAAEDAEVEPALLTPKTGGGFGLLLQGTGEGPADFQVDLRFETAVTNLQQRGPGGEPQEWRRLSFGVPPASVVRFALTVNQPNLEFSIEPSLALEVDRGEESTVIRTFLGGADRVSVRWKTDIARDEEEETRIRASIAAKYDLQPGVVTMSAQVAYEVLQGAVEQVTLSIPQGFRPRSVQAPNIYNWQWGEGDTDLVVTLRQPLTTGFTVTLNLQRSIEDLAGETGMRMLRAQGVQQQTGVVAITADEAYDLRITAVRGLTQKNVSELPGWLQNPTPRAAYEFLDAAAVGLEFEVTRRQPKVRLRVAHMLEILENQRTYRAHLNVMVSQAGIFRLMVEIPEGFRLMQVGPQSVTEEPHPRVEEVTEGEGEDAVTRRVVEIELRRRFLENFELRFFFQAATPDLAGEPEVELPVLRVLHVDQEQPIEQEQGHYAVALVDTVTAQPIDATFRNLLPLSDPGTLFTFDNAPSRPEARNPVALMYEYLEVPIGGQLKLAKKEAQVTALVVNHATVTDETIYRNVIIEYTINYAAVNAFVVRVPDKPEWEDIKFDGPNLTQSEPVPDPDREGFKRYTLSLGGAQARGNYIVWAYWPEPLNVEPNTERDLAFPEVEVLDVTHATGVYLVAQKSTISLYPHDDSQNVEVVDTSEVQEVIDRTDGRLREHLERVGGEAPPSVGIAYRYQRHPHALLLILKRFEFHEQVTTVIQRLHLRTVLNPDQVTRQDVYMEFRSKKQQFLTVSLPSTMRPESLQVFLNGTPVLRVDLTEQEGHFRLRLELDPVLEVPQKAALSYELALGEGTIGLMSGIEFEAPDFGEIPVQETTWNFTLPGTHYWYGFDGPYAELKYADGDRYPVRDITRDKWSAAGLTAYPGEYRPDVEEVGFSRHAGAGPISMSYVKKEVAAVLIALVFILTTGLLLFLPVKIPKLDHTALSLTVGALGMIALRANVWHWEPVWRAIVIGAIIAFIATLVQGILHRFPKAKKAEDKPADSPYTSL